jgi:hypothetical protein
MCISPPGFVPIYEIIADSLFPSGPAAILCNEQVLMECSWDAKGLGSPMDQRVPRMAKMLELYDDPEFLGGLMDDTKGLGWIANLSWLDRKE